MKRVLKTNLVLIFGFLLADHFFFFFPARFVAFSPNLPMMVRS